MGLPSLVFCRTEEDQIEKQAQEKQRRQRLHDQLEESKPRLSTTGKQPMAEQTPVLFHMVSATALLKDLLTKISLCLAPGSSPVAFLFSKEAAVSSMLWESLPVGPGQHVPSP